MAKASLLDEVVGTAAKFKAQMLEKGLRHARTQCPRSGMTMTKICDRCGRVFTRQGACPLPAFRKRRYCSLGCSAKGRARRNTTHTFFDKFIPEPMSGCWLWEGTVHRDGYGQIKIDGTLHRAHRLSYELHKGRVPPTLGVLHKCDTRCCVNPDHLYVGSPADNVDDMVRRGRNRRGEAQSQAKLTERAVKAIRQSGRPSAELARKYGVTRQCIRNVRTGLRWRHVK